MDELPHILPLSLMLTNASVRVRALASNVDTHPCSRRSGEKLVQGFVFDILLRVLGTR